MMKIVSKLGISNISRNKLQIFLEYVSTSFIQHKFVVFEVQI